MEPKNKTYVERAKICLFPNSKKLAYMKALILAGGRGSRLGEITEKTNKCMLSVNGKYVIEYSLDCVIKTEIKSIVIVVGHISEEIINHFEDEYKGRRIKYVIQREQNGLVHSIKV